jgi:thiol-disulfide isomerase/thioredoxin
MSEAKVSSSSSKTLVMVVVGLWVGVLLGAVVVGVLAFTGVIPLFGNTAAGDEQAAPLAKEESGTLAEDFSLSDVNGSTVKLSDYRGKVVVFNFWATWCGPCVEEMPMFEAYQQQYQNFVLLGLNEEETKEQVQAFLAEQELNYTMLLDEKADAAAKYKVMILPTTIFVDEKGEVRFRHYGIMNEEQLKYYLTKLGVITQ